ncbi:hypothetical protein LXL04_022884 [Taraxacum kok-saghyz]
MLWTRTKAFEDLSFGMYKRLWRAYKSLLHRSGKWLLGAYVRYKGTTNVESSRMCFSASETILTSDVLLRIPFLHGMFFRFVRLPCFRMLLRLGKTSLRKIRFHCFGRHNRFGPIPSHHISATTHPKRNHSSAIHISEEIQSIRSHQKSVIRNPIHAQPFTDSGACISGTSQPFLNQKTSYLKKQTAKILVFQVRLLIKDLSISSDYESIFYFLADFHILATRFHLICLNISQQHQQVYPNQNKNLKFHMPCLHQGGACEAPISFLIVGEF